MDPAPSHQAPLIVGLAGTWRPDSTSERALRTCLEAAQALGARVEMIAGAALELPLYGSPGSTAAAARLIESLRRCDGLIVSTPSYHGTLSGTLKNALDYVEELRTETHPYLDGRAVGIIVCAHGVQAIGSTLTGVRSIVHALRGWPTPFGAGLLAQAGLFDAEGRCGDPESAAQLERVAHQVVGFARMSRLASPHP